MKNEKQNTMSQEFQSVNFCFHVSSYGCRPNW